MYSLLHRTNSLLTFFGTVSAVLCILTTSTDLIHKANPSVKVSIAELKRLVPNHGSNDQAVMTLNVEADLRSVFSWNTKQLFVFLQAEYSTPENKLNQIVLWDTIIQSKEKAVIKLRKHKTKYAFLDQHRNLRGRQVNLTLTYNVMPRVGYLYTRKHSFDVGSLPSEYKM